MNVLLLGGGIDSTTLLVHLVKDKTPFDALMVDYGQKAYYGELQSAKYFCDKYRIHLHMGKMDLSAFSTASILRGNSMGDRKGNCLELRNVALLAYASVLCASNGGGIIYLGFHHEDDNVFLDAHTDWLRPMRFAFQQATTAKVEIRTPFDVMSRLSVFKRAKELDPM